MHYIIQVVIRGPTRCCRRAQHRAQFPTHTLHALRTHLQGPPQHTRTRTRTRSRRRRSSSHSSRLLKYLAKHQRLVKSIAKLLISERLSPRARLPRQLALLLRWQRQHGEYCISVPEQSVTLFDCVKQSHAPLDTIAQMRRFDVITRAS